ncbi:MAG: DUF1553 domain-containing protein [Bacteroidota bacterium]
MNRLFLLLLNIGLLYACSSNLPDDIELAMADLPETVDYNFHIKPILSDRCFACHGPDAQNRKANLRLDVPEGAFAKLESGNGQAIVAKNVGKSEVVKRILSHEPEYMMPTPESNLSLDDTEKALLIKWIAQGAAYKPHWAFVSPEQPKVPKAGKEWAVNEIDHFMAQKMQLQKIMPAPEANREQLIRRLFFDTTGLPPSLQDLDKWMAAEEATYYEALVDSLLALPAYGERMAAHWLDVARFADSEGYLDDFHHTFWPYRDWVIRTFNQNLGYDDFILWQVGGDQIPNATDEQILATAFNRNHKQNSEGGVIPEEFRVEYVADRTNTVGTAFMGLTFGCARCHDHKYDPISQENYFELFAFFNSTIERGDGIFGYNSVENGQMISNKLSMNAGPVLAMPDEEVAAIREFLLKEIDEKQLAINQLGQNNQTAFNEWKAQHSPTDLQQAIDRATVSHLTFDDLANGTTTDLVADNTKPTYWGKIQAAEGKHGKALKSNAAGQLVADGSQVSFERIDPFTISFWIQAPKVFEEAHVLYNGNNRIQGYRGWDVTLEKNEIHFRLNHAHPYQSIDIHASEALVPNEWYHFVWTYDGSSDASGMQLYQNGEKIEPIVNRNHLYRSTKPYTDTRATVYMHYRGMTIGNRHYDQDFTDGLVDELRILNREADPLTARYLFDQQIGNQSFTKASNDELDRFYDLMIDPTLETQRIEMRDLQAREVMTIDTVQEMMVMGDFEKERPTYLLERGVYDAPGKQVERDVPEDIFAWSDEFPRNRYGLGKWLTQPDHPLTSRVAVNQFWYLMMGRGLVETVEDFGNQGALPTHPELLDWLAIDFVENGWDVKRLIKQIVTSATYKQSSVIRPELEELDPDNHLLARGMRYRRSAEMVRDNILASSGLLEQKIGGISTFPYQPPGLWKEVVTHPFFPAYEVDYEDGLYRRSIYTFWKRNMPPPNMLIFDASNRGECQMRRQRSSTPLQALVLMNDPQMIEGCRVLAARMWAHTDGNVERASQQIFRLLTSREPNAREQAILLRQYEDELTYFENDPDKATAYLSTGAFEHNEETLVVAVAALARVTNTIMNSTEAYYKN